MSFAYPTAVTSTLTAALAACFIALAGCGPDADVLVSAEQPLVAQNGLTGTYFDDQDFSVRRMARVDATVDFNWGNGSPATSIGSDTFSVRWQGFVVAPQTGTYSFSVLSDDGARLSVGNQTLVNQLWQHPPTEYGGSITMEAGRAYPVRLDYFEGSGGAQVKLSWAGPGVAKQVVPRSALFTADPTLVTDAGSTTPPTVDAGTTTPPPPPTVDAGSSTPPPPPSVDAGTTTPPPPPPVDAGTTTPPPAGSTGKWVSAYYAGWFPEMYPEARIDFSAMTHLMVGRATMNAQGTVTQALDVNAANGVSRATALADRAHAAGKKAVLMLGGVGDGANFASASSAANRANFVRSILQFIDTTHMDGVDLDWEEAINQNDWLSLCRDLKAQRPGLIVTLPVFPVNVNVGLSAADKAFFAAVHPLVEQINVMSYGIGMAGPWGGWVTWHTGALTGEGADHPTSIASTLAAYAAAGVPKTKLGMGIGFGGHNFGAPNTDPLQPIQGSYGGDDIEWRYSRVLGYLNGHQANLKWDAAAQMSYLSFPGGYNPGAGYSTAGFLSFEDERSIAAKGAFTKANGYGGTILWVLNYGCTDPNTGANPLLAAAKQAFLTP